MMKNIILIGAGGHCKSCIDVIEKEKKFKIIGLIDNKKGKILNYKIIGNDTSLKKFGKIDKYALITVGQINDYLKRDELFKLITKLNFKTPIIISPYSVVSNSSKIDKGSIVMHRSVVNSGAYIGKNCIINTGAIVEHDVKIGNNCHISTGVIINGNVKIGNNTFIGSGTIIKNSISVGNNCIIGMNKTISSKVENNQVIK